MRLISLLVAFTLAFVCPHVHAVIPGADKPDAFTDHDLCAAQLAFNRRTLSEAYRNDGKKDPKWDDAAIKFLDRMAIRFVNASNQPDYHIPGGKTPEELEQLARAAIDAGCQDPLVTYCYGVLLHDRGERGEAGPIVERAADDLMKGPYPVLRAAAAQHRLYVLTRSTAKERRDEIYEKFTDATVACAAHWAYRDYDRRHIARFIWDFITADGMERQKQVISAINAVDNVDPWVKHLILGRHGIKLAWEARGKGWAHTVTEDGWRRFYQHLAKAKEHLQQAHNLHPEYPEAAADMITVAMGAGDRLNLNTREWFEKSVAAHIDYDEAYSTYLYTIYPRWGGSIEQMYAFGVECLETRRFDTRVPGYFYYCVSAIARDSGSNDIYFQQGVYENMKEMFEGLAGRKDAPPERVVWHRSLHAAVAWRCERYDEARRLMDQLGSNLVPRAFYDLEVMAQLAASHAYAMRPGLTDEVTAAEQRGAQNLDDGIAAYEEVAAKLAKDDKATYFVRSRLIQLKWQQQFDAGRWVSIQPDKDFIGWDRQQGQWHVDEQGALIGTHGAGDLWLACHAPFLGDNIIVEGKFELLGDRLVCGGLGMTMNGIARHYYAELRQVDGAGQLQTYFYPGRKDEVALEPVNVLRCVFQDGKLSIDVNGRRIVKDYNVEAVFQQPDNYLAVCGYRSFAGATIRVTDLRVRQLRDDESNDPQD